MISPLLFSRTNVNMKNLWNDSEARAFSHSDLAMRVYTSRLLGQNDDLVLHGGGNTSVKSTLTNIFGDEEDILFVKGCYTQIIKSQEKSRLGLVSSPIDLAHSSRKHSVSPMV